ncbi:helix-turn-helix domain-containing protein [Microbacterium sp. MEC084]|uniref:helix-turn-helix domain-containing protein n=1 Tax=Microbacterium sp. MEC084 TaxID=1963027 RepID=UPI00142FD5AA|nr:helix-turn-helix transcriptional regulator [Microbacterium sp. MEC084]MCD1267779.1 helix-turn-helix domain-containing protein [Microbacterium sp. MEC084]
MARTPSPAAAVIGENIRGARDAKNWTQDQLAAATGIDSSNIRAYETGRSLTNLHSLIRISEALGADPADLLRDVTSDMFVSRADDGRRTRTHRASGSSAA